jgi:hypothetical protein
MKNVIFWDVVLCRSCVNRRFGGTYHFHLRGISVSKCSLQPPADAGSTLADFSTLKMEAIRSSETSVDIRSTQRHIPEDDILQLCSIEISIKHTFYFYPKKVPQHIFSVFYQNSVRLVGYNAPQFCWSRPLFQSSVLPPHLSHISMFFSYAHIFSPSLAWIIENILHIICSYRY